MEDINISFRGQLSPKQADYIDLFGTGHYVLQFTKLILENLCGCLFQCRTIKEI